jgi:protoporphyrinogen/coproporphyrinogen III oxidase
MHQSPPVRFAVIGGGVSGLAAARRLHELLPAARLRLFEAGPRLGGALDTRRGGGLVLEQGADSFLTREPWAVDLCRELGLTDELLPTSSEHRRALVVCRGRLLPVPEGFVLMQPRSLGGVLRSPVLSWGGKLRVLVESRVRPAKGVHAAGYDESVASFATRRLGREAFERLVEPLVGGIYTADASELSLAATFPEFLAAEREKGSLRAAAQVQRTADPDSGARYGAFVTLKSGLSTLVDALASSLPADCVRTATPIAEILPREGRGWQVVTAARDAEEFDGVIVAAPAARTATMLKTADAELATSLGRITAASSAVVTLVYEQAQIARPLDGFGFVVPRIENRAILAASFPSVKFAGRGPSGLVPVRVFLGGALRPEMVDKSDEELTAIAQREMAELIDARGEPRETCLARWREAMPQYQVGHLQIVEAIEQRVNSHRGLELAGNSYRGVGIPQCIRSGRVAAERLARQFA